MTTTEFAKAPIFPTEVSTIRRDGGTQARVGNNEETVEAYAETMRDDRWKWTVENSVVVVKDPKGIHWLADGFHRVEAAQRAGRTIVWARVLKGDRRDAVLYAAGANATHGLRRTRADVRRAIEVLLRDEEWVKWSNAEIARKVRCSDKTVASVRIELTSASEIPRLTERQGADGKTYTMPQASPARPVAVPVVVEEMDAYEAAPPLNTVVLDALMARGWEFTGQTRLDREGISGAPLWLYKLLPPPGIGDGPRWQTLRQISGIVTDKPLFPVASLATATIAPTAPALSAFPPGHVEAGIGMLERRLREGTTQLAEDMQWAATFRTQLDAAREGMQPEVYGTWSARLDSARDALVRLEAYNKEFRCAHCRSVGTMLIGKFCQSCYSLTEAQKWPVGSEDARWRLKQAFTAAEAMQDATIRAGRIAEIRDVADAHKIDLDAPIIEAPQAAPVKKSTPTSQAILLQHAESMLAGVIEAIPDTAITLVAALVCWEYEPYSGDDPREALFQTLKILAKDNLDVVETAIEKGRS